MTEKDKGAAGMTPKEIYDRKKRLARERKLRSEEAWMARSNSDLEGEILVAAAVVALEGIAEALARLAAREDTP